MRREVDPSATTKTLHTFTAAPTRQLTSECCTPLAILHDERSRHALHIQEHRVTARLPVDLDDDPR
jgi:hypothetical protein